MIDVSREFCGIGVSCGFLGWILLLLVGFVVWFCFCLLSSEFTNLCISGLWFGVGVLGLTCSAWVGVARVCGVSCFCCILLGCFWFIVYVCFCLFRFCLGVLVFWSRFDFDVWFRVVALRLL